jgi:hypothetical protein
MWGEVDFDQFKTVSQAYSEMFIAQRKEPTSIGTEVSVFDTAIKLGSPEEDSRAQSHSVHRRDVHVGCS